jgi:hypothetical protein
MDTATTMTPQDLFAQLTSHAQIWGYGSLTQEERGFVLRFRKTNGITKAPAMRKKTRKPRNGTLIVDKRLATWNPKGVDLTYRTCDAFSENYLRLLHS